MDDVKRGEVAEGGGGEDAVAVVQRVEVHHAQVQQLRGRGEVKGQDGCLHHQLSWVRLGCEGYLRDLDVRLLGELRHQEVLSVLLSFDLSVQLQPRDRRLRTQIPVQRLRRERREDASTLGRQRLQLQNQQPKKLQLKTLYQV